MVVGHALALTLTLSRREREQPRWLFPSLSAVDSNPAAGLRMTPGAFHPLPAGEGRGEGENLMKTTDYNFS